MANRWFRIPTETISTPDGTIERRPKYVLDGPEISGSSGHPVGSSPLYVIRVYGTTTALNDLERQADVVNIDRSKARSLFDSHPTVSSSNIDKSFQVGDH